MSYARFVTDLKELNIKKKGKRPKVAPAKFYPSQAELQATEALQEELGDYAHRLEKAAQRGNVADVYAILGAPPAQFREEAARIARSVHSFQVKAFANFSELVVGERFFQSADKKELILNTWTDNFVNLCKSTNEEMRKKVAGVISDGVLSGRNLREMIKEVQNTCSDFSRSKAELIATTEIGKLNTAIAQDQSKSAGIEYYEWAAAMDGRTRESHAVMDGKICKWGDDTGYYSWDENADGKRKLRRHDRPANAYNGAPGTDFRCRCVAIPYVPEFEDDYEREDGPVQGVTQGKNADPETTKRNEKIYLRKERQELLKSQNRSRKAALSYLEDLKKNKPSISTELKKPPYKEVGKFTLADTATLELAKKNLKEKEKFKLELINAASLEEQEWLVSVFVGEVGGVGKSNVDAFIDGVPAEYKHVEPTSKINAVGGNIREAIHQGAKIIVLDVQAQFDKNVVRNKINGRLKGKSGIIVYYKVVGNDRFHRISV